MGVNLGSLLGMGALGSYYGNQLGQALSQAQQQQFQQTAGTANSYVMSIAPVESIPVRQPGPETALEWLDRRVNEIRLPLAA